MELLVSLFSHTGIIEIICFAAGIIFFMAKLDNNSQSNKELLNAEIAHVVKLMETNHNNLREDIGRLEKKQEESNKIKERLAMQEVLTADMQVLLRTHLAEFHELTQQINRDRLYHEHNN